LVCYDVRDEVVLGLEVGVEGSVGQPGIRHERGDAGSVDPVQLEPLAGPFDDPLPRHLLVLLGVARHRVPFLSLCGAIAAQAHINLLSDARNIMTDR
jgi:hypothetical protein